MKKNKDLVFTEVEEFLGHELKKMSPLDIGEVIANAINEAAVNKISANAVIINKKYAKTERIFYDTGCGLYEIPPMICGLYLEFCDLPKEFAFAVTEIPKPYFYRQIDEFRHRAEVAERALLTVCTNIVTDEEDDLAVEPRARVLYNAYLKQAEKELAEEGKE